MAVFKISPKEFLEMKGELPLFDTRAPAEYKQGHIPGAVNLPLFTDEERKKVGTLYKQRGKEPAVLQGLDFVGPKLTSYIKNIKSITEDRRILMHCWRGGMRSASMAWLVDNAGYDVYLLEGGYKAYRSFIRESLGLKMEKLFVLGGMTGTGKTEIIGELEKLGEQVIDLEGLASHKGSAFGTIGMEEQPTNEQFENELYDRRSSLDLTKRIWVEDESKRIGKVEIVEEFFRQMREAPLIRISLPKEERVKRLTRDYGFANRENLIAPVQRISRRLGSLREREVIEHINCGEIDEAVSKVLDYYDKGYAHGNSKRDQNKVFDMDFQKDSPAENALKIVEFAKTILLPAQ